MLDRDISENIQQQVVQAIAEKKQLNIISGNSKRFYGREAHGEPLNVSEHSGIIHYDPTELVVTVRAGTKLHQLETVLAEKNQMLAFEPPAYGDSASIGGTIACNFSGPRRAYAGAARDFVSGVRMMNGKAEILRFGGEVMKNVAGYDVSRLMCGAMGTLGVLLDVSLRVLPKPECEYTTVLEMNAPKALAKIHALTQQPYPVSASCFDGDRLYIRFSGSAGAVDVAKKMVGGSEVTPANKFWQQVKEHRHGFFQSNLPLWRLSLASNAPVVKLAGKTLYEWNGAQRWLLTDADASSIRRSVAEYGGHAVCFRRAAAHVDVFHPLERGIAHLHKQLKKAFDPNGVFNPGRMYAAW